MRNEQSDHICDALVANDSCYSGSNLWGLVGKHCLAIGNLARYTPTMSNVFLKFSVDDVAMLYGLQLTTDYMDMPIQRTYSETPL